jgi:CubicO group peptidase (beta-lactamase class C family)
MLRRRSLSVLAGMPFAMMALLAMAPQPVKHGLPMAKAEEVGMSSERLERINKRIAEYIDAGQIAGAVTLVARDGKVVHLESHGYRNREERIPMETDDMFVIMSMTKPIAATALMMLYEEGKFLLTDPISKWLPEFAYMRVRVPDGQGGFNLVPARPITVRHVMSQSAGLTSTPTPGASRTVEEGAAATTRQPGDSPLRARVRGFAANPLNFQPGERWEYSNGGIASDVVAALVEVMSGQNMDQFLRERIFQPLGMNDTYYNVPREKWERRARVYAPQRENNWQLDPRPVTDPTPTTLFGGIAGLTSTAPDYFKFAQMVMNGGEYNGVRLLSPKTINLMITNHLADGIDVTLKGPGYGFGLGYSVLMDAGKSSEPLSPGSYGWGGAWGTYYFNDPVENLIGILMIQITSYGHVNIRSDMTTLATQAIIEPKSTGTQRIRGYEPLD